MGEETPASVSNPRQSQGQPVPNVEADPCAPPPNPPIEPAPHLANPLKKGRTPADSLANPIELEEPGTGQTPTGKNQTSKKGSLHADAEFQQGLPLERVAKGLGHPGRAGGLG